MLKYKLTLSNVVDVKESYRKSKQDTNHKTDL